jgi:pyruvate/2-oxoglutarate/acetoin dehydrogenase E1 component
MRQMTFKDAIREAIREEMLRDNNIFVMGEDVGRYGNIFKVTLGFIEEFGTERIRDTPISESAIIGFAAGAAMIGGRPIAEIMYIDFTTTAMDPIVNQVAKSLYHTGGQIKVPLVIRTQGGIGRSNASQQSQSLEAWFMHVPGLEVVMPATPYDAKGLLKTAIRRDNPVLFIEHKALYATVGPVPEGEYTIPFGQADVKRKGEDVTIIATSREVLFALKAAEELAKEGIAAEVIDPRTLVPLDIDTMVQSVQKTNRVVIVHEAVKTGGVAAEIGMQLMEKSFDYLDAPIKRVAAPDLPVPHSPYLEKLVLPNELDLIKAVHELIF